MIRTSNRVALYARFSSDNQRSESIDAQIRAMKAYCKQNSMIIVEIYIDEAKSGTTDRRPAFQQMISDSSQHTFNILLVHKLDRFARSRYDSAVYKRELKKNGVSVYSVLENLDDSPESIMMESVLEGMSEYYSQNLAREVMKGMKETALQCKHTGGSPPLGYDVDPVSRKLVINQDEAETVRCIFSMFANGYGYSAILEVLNKRGCKTKRGQDFNKTSFYSILTNPKYQGIYVFNKCSAKSITGTRNTHLLKETDEIISIDGGCPQIVDTEIYDRVQKRIDKNKHSGASNGAKHIYLLSGLVFCKECGKSMTGNARSCGRSKKMYVTYRCASKSYVCRNKEINRDYLERYVIGLLEKHIFNVSAMKRIAKKILTMSESYTDIVADEQAALQAKLNEVNTAIKNITDVIMSGLVSEALTDKLTELENEKAGIETSIATLDGRSKDSREAAVDPFLIPHEYAELKNSPGSPLYKNFIQSFISRIEIGRYGLSVTIKTGLDIFPNLDTTLTVSRKEVYEQGKIAS